MGAMHLYERLQSVKNDIGCLRKGFESVGNFEIQNLRLTTATKKIEEINNYVSNMGSSNNYPIDLVTLQNMFDCLKKIEKEVEQLIVEIEKCPAADEIYFCAYKASCEPFG